MELAIRGGGVAAATCAELLRVAGHSVSREIARRARVPALMLGESAQSLLRDLHDRPDLLAEPHRIRRRIVAWGGADPVSMPHEAVVVSEAGLQRELEQNEDASAPVAAVEFTVFTAAPLPESEPLVFGDRAAFAGRVAMRGATASEECRVEALEAGWLFLIPKAPGRGWLLGFGAPLEHLLAQSRLVAPVVELESADASAFAAAPHLSLPLAGDGWLACGSAALGFDPICGDGTAQALREAVLACAVIAGIAGGGDRAKLLTHYRSMLIAAMRRHLDLCARFYASGGDGPWWREQTAMLAQGHQACTRILAETPEPQFMLRGFALEPKAVAA